MSQSRAATRSHVALLTWVFKLEALGRGHLVRQNKSGSLL